MASYINNAACHALEMYDDVSDIGGDADEKVRGPVGQGNNSVRQDVKQRYDGPQASNSFTINITT